jgi:hypothetical protein
MENKTMINHLAKTIKLPEDFDWKTYLIKNIDLVLSGFDSEEQATDHYLKYGRSENRVYFEDKKIDHFVFCGGRSGSMILTKTFSNNNNKVYTTHGNEFSIAFHKKSAYNLINNSKNANEKIYIIDSYRNPIERKMSSFFFRLDKENYSLPMNVLIKKFNEKCIENESNIIINFKTGNCDNIISLIKKISQDIIIDEIHENYIRTNVLNDDNLNILCNILDKNKESLEIISYKKINCNYYDYYHPIDELFRHYNISETFTNFDFDKKYGMHQYENIVFIKLRFCDINDWSKILSGIFGKEIKILPDNSTEQKEYYNLYKEFKSNCKIQKSFIKELLRDRHFNAYNTVEERRQYIKYWLDHTY